MADLTKIMILVHCNEWGEIREREGGMERERGRDGERKRYRGKEKRGREKVPSSKF